MWQWTRLAQHRPHATDCQCQRGKKKTAGRTTCDHQRWQGTNDCKAGVPDSGKEQRRSWQPISSSLWLQLFPVPALVQLKRDHILLAGTVHSHRVMTIFFLNVLHAHYPATTKGWRSPLQNEIKLTLWQLTDIFFTGFCEKPAPSHQSWKQQLTLALKEI